MDYRKLRRFWAQTLHQLHQIHFQVPSGGEILNFHQLNSLIFEFNSREYIYSRGNLLINPNQDDESFSSQPDDFESSNEYQKLETSSSSSSQNKTQEIDKILNQSSMSESLLYCLDGNGVSPSPSKSRKRQHDSDDSLKEDSSESLKRPLIEQDLTDL